MRSNHTTKVINNSPSTNFSCGSTYPPTQAINLAILPSSLKWQQSSYNCVEGTVSVSGSRRIPCWQWQFTLWSQGKRQGAEPLDFPQKASFSPDLESLTSSLCSSGSELLTNWSAPPSVVGLCSFTLQTLQPPCCFSYSCWQWRMSKHHCTTHWPLSLLNTVKPDCCQCKSQLTVLYSPAVTF